ncbi:MAG: bifunctional ornithine acetyltransferase/N-acetylglutamate synthase, partial [Burkholderiaceae bacterium]
MPVNYQAPVASDLHPVAGVSLGSTNASIRRGDNDDVLLMQFDARSVAAGVFTRNRFCAAPVVLCREHLSQTNGQVRAILVNAGNANAGTGAGGLADARDSCAAVAQVLGCDAEHVLPMSTGVILERLPMDKLLNAVPLAAKLAKADNWLPAAQAIM